MSDVIYDWRYSWMSSAKIDGLKKLINYNEIYELIKECNVNTIIHMIKLELLRQH